MTSSDYQQALQVARKLTEKNDATLFEDLGLRIRDMENLGGYERSQQFDADFEDPAPEMGLSLADLREIGRRWYEKAEAKIMQIICGQDQENLHKLTAGKSLPEIAAALATAGVMTWIAPPAWIIVATSILAAKIAEAGLEALCEVWHESQPT